MKSVVLWETNFPFVDTAPVDRSAFAALGEGSDTLTFANVAELGAALADREAVLITPYGSAFPKAAWPVITDFLRAGGSWVNLGGSPLSRPVRRTRDGGWQIEVSQTAYSKELRINQAFPIDFEAEGIRLDRIGEAGEASFWEWADALQREGEADKTPLIIPPMTRAWGLQPRFTDTLDFPHEHGSGGTRDASLRTLAYAGADGRRLAAPIIAIDRLRGPFAGGRWALVNAELTAPLDPALLRWLVRHAAQGPVELEVRPSFACYYAGETPSLTVRIKSHRRRGEASIALSIHREGAEPDAYQNANRMALSGQPYFAQIGAGAAQGEATPGWSGDGLLIRQPGLVTVEARLVSHPDGEILATTETGYWGYDADLLASGRPLTTNRDYFERDGEPYPVMGTTYMAGDAHRKFLFEPNCAVWNRDFAAMKAAGVNLVRTGLWTAFRRAMLDPGAIDEGVLRAFAAFLLTARRYDLPVIFNFFAFLPEMWNGVNPYFDPRAVEAQKELVAAFAHRFANVNDLMWDFINEPSFSSPRRVWATRPNYDEFERAAWADWLKERAGDFSPDEAACENPDDVWRERWRLTPNASLDLPALEDFTDRYIFRGTHPLRVLDYRRFAQEQFARWVETLSATIRSNGNPDQLITVGQDEGGAGERPNPHFHARSVDFTTNHSWWNNDDLLWDSVMTKTPNKPNLIQETGIMFVENPDGGYRRSPQECAELLARKLTLAFAGGCAGAIQWLWNTNVLMDEDNEVGIGFLRADGTEKPELEAFRGLAKFFWENRQFLVGRRLEETCIVIPHSNMLGIRDQATTATKHAVRTLEYELGVPTRTVSEYEIAAVGEAKLIVLPAPRVLTQACWEALLAKVEAGATLLVTGPIDSDEYWRDVPRLKRLGIEAITQPLAQHEPLTINGNIFLGVNFRGDSIHKVEKAAGKPGETLTMQTLERGGGRIIYSPLPLELGDKFALSWAYRQAVHTAFARKKLRSEREQFELLIRHVELAEHTLYLMVNEGGSEEAKTLFRYRKAFGFDKEAVAVPPGQVAISFINRETGLLAAQYHSAGEGTNRETADPTANETPPGESVSD